MELSVGGANSTSVITQALTIAGSVDDSRGGVHGALAKQAAVAKEGSCRRRWLGAVVAAIRPPRRRGAGRRC